MQIWELMKSKAGFYRIEMELRRRVFADKGIVTNETLTWYCRQMSDMEIDNNILVCGQNGSGKSITGSNLAFDLKEAGFKSIISVFRDTNIYKLGSDICKNEESVFFIDELKKYLYYMAWNSKGQRALMDSIEVGRENRNVLIGCTKEPDKINGAYRDGKIHTVIFLLDREKNQAPFGFVLHAYVYLDQVDKFNFEYLMYARSLRQIVEMADENDMFLGWYFAESEIKFDLKEYKEKKKKAVEELSKVLDLRAQKEGTWSSTSFITETQTEKAASAILRHCQDKALVNFTTREMMESQRGFFARVSINRALAYLGNLGYIKKEKRGIWLIDTTKAAP
jgi:hypothetical protein